MNNVISDSGMISKNNIKQGDVIQHIGVGGVWRWL